MATIPTLLRCGVTISILFSLSIAVGVRAAPDPGGAQVSEDRAITTAAHLRASTFFGGAGFDGHYEVPIAIDTDGDVFVASRTSSSAQLATAGAFDT